MRYPVFILLAVLGVFTISCKKKTDSPAPAQTKTCLPGKVTVYKGNSRQRIFTYQTDPDGTVRYSTLQDTNGIIQAKQVYEYTSGNLTGATVSADNTDIAKDNITLDSKGNITEVDFNELNSKGGLSHTYSNLYTYDRNNKITKFMTKYYRKNGSDSGRVINTYQYDAKGNVTSYVISDSAGTELGNVQLSYDSRKNYLRNFLILNDIPTAFSENNILSTTVTDIRTGFRVTTAYAYQFNEQGYATKITMSTSGQPDESLRYDYICF